MLYSILSGLTVLSLVFFFNKKYVSGFVCLLLTLAWAFYLLPVLRLLTDLGVDSFTEATNFEWKEALFFIHALSQEVSNELNYRYLRRIAAIITISSLVYFALSLLYKKSGFSPKKQRILQYSLAGLLIIPAIILGINKNISVYLDTIQSSKTLENNFRTTNIIVDDSERRPLTVLTYIGESTSAMNMGIYGYFRNTTPRLQEMMRKDQGFLLYHHVFSTHTITSPSLLEAFSIPQNHQDFDKPINERKRTSIVDILISAGIQPYLVSNQGKTGTWNQSANIIFGHATRIFSDTLSNLGNMSKTGTFDHVLFEQHEKNILDKIRQNSGGMFFFHSYAGHGSYLENIPPDFRSKVDDKLGTYTPKAVTGQTKPLGDIEAYDSAIRYIDYSVSHAIEKIKSRKEPIVFVYFSDHGESVYANRSHDSSRHTFEMLQIPFIVYFNKPAQKQFPELYNKYKKLAHTGEIATLDQLTTTLLDLQGLKVKNDVADQEQPIGEKQAVHHPVLVRKTAKGITYVNLNSSDIDAGKPDNILDNTDAAIKTFSLMQSRQAGDPELCYHRSNTIAKALRGTNAANCLETDVVVEADGRLAVYHPPLPSNNLNLSEIIKLANHKQTSLWLDSKNLDTPQSCHALADFLGKHKPESGNVMVEFPSTASITPEMQACSKRIQDLGFRTSYYVSTEDLDACTQSLQTEKGATIEKAPACQSLKKKLIAVQSSKMFSDFSFDYSGAGTIEQMGDALHLRLNAWFVPPQSWEKIRQSRKYGFIMINNKDPNTY